MVRLLDLNLLIALAWPSHVHHPQAHAWFAGRGGASWATCPFTQCGFVRLSSNPRMISDAVAPQQALAVLEEVVAYPHHVFWPDAVPLVGTDQMPTSLLVGHSHFPFACQEGRGLMQADEAGLIASLERGRMVINPGSVGQPRDGDPRAAYAVYDDAGTVALRRTPYDISATQRAMGEAGLPDPLIARLSAGR